MKTETNPLSEASRGVFWVVEGRLLSFPYRGDSVGAAKSGATYNHKKLWLAARPKGCDKPFNYYPRGRVEFSNKGKPIVWANPNVGDEWLPQIKNDFGLHEEPAIKYDYSEHYKCCLDDGWKAD
jgi:hypothetical protein